MKSSFTGTYMFVIFLVVLISSVLGQPNCPKKKPKKCTNSAICGPDKACLGPPGNKVCRDCLCSVKSQCYLDEGSVKCNCNNSGHVGDHCECKKDDHSDILYWHSTCLKYSDQFLIIDNGFWVGECDSATKSFVYAEEMCFQKCEVQPTCYLAFNRKLGPTGYMCFIFMNENPPMLGYIMGNILQSEFAPHSVRLRNCIERKLIAD